MPCAAGNPSRGTKMHCASTYGTGCMRDGNHTCARIFDLPPGKKKKEKKKNLFHLPNRLALSKDQPKPAITGQTGHMPSSAALRHPFRHPHIRSAPHPHSTLRASRVHMTQLLTWPPVQSLGKSSTVAFHDMTSDEQSEVQASDVIMMRSRDLIRPFLSSRGTY